VDDVDETDWERPSLGAEGTSASASGVRGLIAEGMVRTMWLGESELVESSEGR
jgi:hypothetical protein